MRRLLIRPGGIGDLIVSLPALERLRAEYLEVWSLARNLPLVRFADAVAPIASTGIELAGITEPPASLWTRLRSFDSIVSWHGASRPEFRDALANFPVRFFPALPPADWQAPASTFYMRQAAELAPCGAADTAPRIPCEAPHEDFIAIQPFSGGRRKNWPLERFRELAEQLPYLVRWCAGPEEDLPGAVRIDDLYELARWLRRARLYIGNDSGISHLAAAVGTPVVAIFGPTDPAVWAPQGGHVTVIRAPGGDLQALGVHEAAAVVHNMLKLTCA
jgi:hypothetical protein